MAEEWGSKITTTEKLVMQLAKSMKLMSHFLVDRDKVIDGTALPEDEKAILKSGDPAEINELLSRHLPPGRRKNFRVLANGSDIFNCTS
jgi:hypothetical protein